MGRGRRGLLDELAVLPWPAGVVGVLGYLFTRHGIPAWASGQPGPLAQALGNTDAFAPLAWIVLAACAMASLFSWLDARRKRRLLDAQSGLASIAALGWRDFERLVGEAFRRQGYTVEESRLGGAARFAVDKLIQLIDNDALFTMIRSVQAVPREKSDASAIVPPSFTARIGPMLGAPNEPQPIAPGCPRCGEAMVKRTARFTAETFWGCGKR